MWLGVDAVWLSPIYRSPMADFGYDVSDHCDVDPVFGTLADADALVAEAHALGLRVLLDWVPNHTSDRHRWFAEHPDWYVWRDGRGPDGADPPNNWMAAFGDLQNLPPAWTRDPETGRWYLHLFLAEQPDVDWGNPGLEHAMHDVLRFWLDRGIDGFRADVVHCIGKDPVLPDDPPGVAGIPHCAVHEDQRTLELLGGIRAVLDAYDGDCMMVGEVYLIGTNVTERTAKYVGPDRLHLSFDFSALFAEWGDAARWRRIIERIEAAYPDGSDKWPTWVLSNHDKVRHRSRYGSDAAARAAAMLLLGLRGTPFLYAGEELGLEDAVISPERVVDPGGRDGCRAPIPWTAEPDHGWTSDPWLPFPPDAAARSVEAQRTDPASMAWLYKRLLAARKASPALQGGALTLLDDAGAGLLAWERAGSGDRRAVVVDVAGFGGLVPEALRSWTVVVASDGPVGEGELAGDTLRPGRSVWLRPS